MLFLCCCRLLFLGAADGSSLLAIGFIGAFGGAVIVSVGAVDVAVGCWCC